MTDVINLASDNVAGAAPEILAAIARAADGRVPSYGADAATKGLETRLSEVFERRVAVFPVPTGTAANALALATFTPPYGAVLCHREAHVAVDECNAPEFFSHGAKLILAAGDHGKLTPATVDAAFPEGWRGDVHRSQPATLTLSQAIAIAEHQTGGKAYDAGVIVDHGKSRVVVETNGPTQSGQVVGGHAGGVPD